MMLRRSLFGENTLSTICIVLLVATAMLIMMPLDTLLTTPDAGAVIGRVAPSRVADATPDARPVGRADAKMGDGVWQRDAPAVPGAAPGAAAGAAATASSPDAQAAAAPEAQHQSPAPDQPAPVAMAATAAPPVPEVVLPPVPEALIPLRDLLLERANYWAGKQQAVPAIDAYTHVFDIAPENPDALAGIARMQLETDDKDGADATLERLRRVAPADPRLASLAWRRAATPETAQLVADAEHLASENKMTEAVAAYKKAFGGGIVPDDLAGEYDPVLVASLPPDSVDANDALTALQAVADRLPNDMDLQLATAKTMTALEGSRADGVEKLRALAKNTSVAEQARKAWRDAILWQGADFTAQDELETYLKENPSDPELEAKRKEFSDSLPSVGVRARMRAYEAMRVKDMATAVKEFQSALAFDAKDVDAMIMIAAIDVQAHQKAAAQPLINKALALAPDRREELLGLVGEDPAANARAAAAAAKAVAAQYAEVTQLSRQGAFDKAAKRLRTLMVDAPNAGNYLLLADLQAKAGQLDAATASLNQVLRLQPGNGDALQALAAVQTRQGKSEEAAATNARLEALYARTNNRTALDAINQGKAAPLRQQAAAAKDPAEKLALLRRAFVIDPGDPWLRLDLARAMLKAPRGGPAEAQRLMADVVPSGGNASETQAGLQAGFVWAQERGDLAQAASYADRLPAGQRTPQMAETQARVKFAAEIRRAVRPGDPATTREALMALADRPDPAGWRGVDLARAALKAGDAAGVGKLLDAALAATAPPTAQQRLAYAGLLTEARQNIAAHAMLDHVEPASLPAALRSVQGATENGLAAQEADTLTGKGKLAEAYKILAPRLAQTPGDRWLSLSMSRWQIASGHPQDALKTTMAMLQADAGDKIARQVAIDAAISAEEYARANDLLKDGLTRFPDDADFLMEAARVATARDRKLEAIDYLKRARALRTQQLPLTSTSTAPTSTAPASTAPASTVPRAISRARTGSGPTPL
jgi:tetratricopeptide (TPR) repeat protein